MTLKVEDVNVVSATQVRLTTQHSIDENDYELTVSNVKSSGGVVIDPAHDTASYTGNFGWEKQFRNLASYTEDLTNAVYTKIQDGFGHPCTISANGETLSTGSTTMDGVISPLYSANYGSAVYGVKFDKTLTAETYTLSVEAVKGNKDWLYLSMNTAMSWTQRATGAVTKPSGRQSHSMAYDSSRDKIVMFGGWTGVLSQETWEYDCATCTWEEKATGAVTKPSARLEACMAYDASRRKVVLFGGTDGTGVPKYSNTYEYDCDSCTWALVNNGSAPGVTNPSGRARAAMAYDSTSEKVILFGGLITFENNETWEWNGITQLWTQKATGAVTKPSARQYATMVCNPYIGKLVLFGGCTNWTSGTRSNETWEWDNILNSWANVTPSGTKPSSRYSHCSGYDVKRNKLIIFSGYDGTYLNDIWEYDKSSDTWTNITPSSGNPSGRQLSAMSYATSNGKCVIFGGLSLLQDTWEFSTNAYAFYNISTGTLGTIGSAAGAKIEDKGTGNYRCSLTALATARSYPITICPAESDGVLKINGDGITVNSWIGAVQLETAYAVTNYLPVLGAAVSGPSARYGINCVYDSVRNVVVLFGGYVAAVNNETWEYNGTNWTQKSPTHSPDATYAYAMAYDPSRQVTVLYGGGAIGSYKDTTWEWDGTDWCPIRTQMITQPIDFTNAYWQKTRVSIPATVVTLPTGGTNTKNTVITTASGGDPQQHYLGTVNPITIVSGIVYVFSVYLKAVNRTWAQIAIDMSPAYYTVYVNTATGAIGTISGVGVTAGSEAAANGWYRFWVRFTSTKTSCYLWVVCADADGDDIVSGAGTDDYYIWGAQLQTRALTAFESTEVKPSARASSSMTYDANIGKCILFGGFNSPTYYSQTWAYNGAWEQLSPATTPAARAHPALCYDSTRTRTIMFGGHYNTSTGIFNDTWEYNGTDWAQVAHAQSPSVRGSMSMVYDSYRQLCLIFSGVSDESSLSSTTEDKVWAFNGTRWDYFLTETRPTARTQYGFAYDSTRHVSVLFGGTTGSNQNDTWELKSYTSSYLRTPGWEQINVTSTLGRMHHAMGYYPTLGKVIAYGGATTTGDTYSNTTYSYDGKTWTNLSLTSPANLRMNHLIYDPINDWMVMFGGQASGSSWSQKTWRYNGSAWADITPGGTKPTGRSMYAACYDSARGKIVIFGGATSWTTWYVMTAETWEWNCSDGTWLRRHDGSSPGVSCPEARVSSAMAYDPVRQKCVLFGGRIQAGQFSDTWEWDGTLGTWTKITPATTTPLSRYGHIMAYFVPLAKVIMLDGISVSTWLYDFWTWDGTDWEKVVLDINKPSTWCGGGCYDSTLQKMICHGGQTQENTLNTATWEYTHTTENFFAPRVSSATVVDATHIDVTFDEAMDQTTMETAANYTISGAGTPTVSASVKQTGVTTRLTIPFGGAGNYTVTVANVKDAGGKFVDPLFNSATFTVP